MDYFQLRSFYILLVCTFWLSYILHRNYTDKSVTNYWGFRKENFHESITLLVPLIIISIVITVVYGYLKEIIILNWHILPVLVLYPVWGIFQQFFMLGLIMQNLNKLVKINFNKLTLLIITSTLFSLIHYPNPFLMLFTFIMEVVFITVYMKWLNLWAIGLAHGWIASFLLYFVLGRDLWLELFVWF